MKAPEVVPPIQTFEAPKGRDIYLLMATNRNPHWALFKALLDLYDKEKMRFWVQPTNYLPRGRNQLAARFLDSGMPWSLWIDDDVVPPHGDAAFFKAWTQFQNFPDDFLNVHPIYQLMSRNEKFIGGVYFRHNIDGKAQFAEAYANPQVNAVAHTGPRNVHHDASWVPFGWTLVHRDVFLDVIKQGGDELLLHPDMRALQGYTYRFFSPIADEVQFDASEDVSFCARARRAGHKTFVDHAVFPAHVGQQAFGYWNTRGVNPQLR